MLYMSLKGQEGNVCQQHGFAFVPNSQQHAALATHPCGTQSDYTNMLMIWV
jgi:hypothetical protein